MRKLTLPLALLFVLVVANSCVNPFNKSKDIDLKDINFTSVKVDSNYVLSIPDFMTATKELNDEASLQYMDAKSEAYVIVIDEPKEDFINAFDSTGQYNDSLSIVDNYSQIQLSLIKEKMTESMVHNQKPLKINGLDAVQVEFTGKIADVTFEIAYHITFIESSKNMYMIMSWTLKDYEQKFKPLYEKMAASFRLLSVE
jgi:hypothetical protein